jgi:uncharacterized SAM-binding protein YcdF (DUF218 family)
MFFVVSKTFGLLLLPTNFLVALGLLAALLLLTRFAGVGRRLLVVVIVLFAIAGLSPLGNVLLHPLESRFPVWDASKGAPDGIVVLGGPIDADVSVAHGMPVTVGGADRLIQAAALARRYPNARVLFTGGSANLLSNDAKEADFAAEILTSLGVAKDRLILERLSRNTYENAVFSKAIVTPKAGERWLLVTSAYHMPRSVGLFRKVGFPVEPYPVDWRVGDVFDFDGVVIQGLRRTDIAVREWMGLIAYRLRGRIDQLFPGPN